MLYFLILPRRAISNADFPKPRIYPSTYPWLPPPQPQTLSRLSQNSSDPEQKAPSNQQELQLP